MVASWGHDATGWRAALKRGLVASGGFALAASLQAPGLLIVRYHSVQPEPMSETDAIGAGIIHSQGDFAAQMEYLARTCRVLSLDEAEEKLRLGMRLPRRAVVVTFDDGFYFNLEVALPILERLGLPATIYVVSGAVGGIPWYCSLRYAFTRTPRTAAVDPLTGDGWDLSEPGSRGQSFLASSARLACLGHEAIAAALAAVEAALDVHYEPARPLMMTWDGVRTVLRRGYIIGSHTVTHPNLAHVPRAEAEVQLNRSRAVLQEQTGDAIRHFSYPSPILQPHWNCETVAACERAGYSTAVTCTPGAGRRIVERLRLPRISAPKGRDAFVWALENAFAGRFV